jgi:hypothetical protein
MPFLVSMTTQQALTPTRGNDGVYDREFLKKCYTRVPAYPAGSFIIPEFEGVVSFGREF